MRYSEFLIKIHSQEINLENQWNWGIELISIEKKNTVSWGNKLDYTLKNVSNSLDLRHCQL